MPLEPELEAIFNTDPRFREVLADYERRGTSDTRDPGTFKVAEVTDEALRQYIESGFPSLAPVVARNDSQKFGPGQSGPAPRNINEDEVNDETVDEPVVDEPVVDEPVTDPETDPETPVDDPAAAAQAALESQRLEALRQQAAATQAAATDVPFRQPGQLPEDDPEQLATWRAFDAIVQSDPRLQQILVQYLSTGEVPSSPVAPVPPPDLDMTDPAVKQLWDQHLATQQNQQAIVAQTNQAIAELNSRIEQQQQMFAQRTRSENDQLVDRVRQSFAKQHELDDTEALRIENVAANLGVMAHLIQGRDPITGQAAPGDPASLVERAFEIAYAADPISQERHRQSVLASEQAKVRTDQERRRKLAGVAGGSAAQSRTPTAPTTAEGRREAMIAELGTHMYGQGE